MKESEKSKPLERIAGLWPEGMVACSGQRSSDNYRAANVEPIRACMATSKCDNPSHSDPPVLLWIIFKSPPFLPWATERTARSPTE